MEEPQNHDKRKLECILGLHLWSSEWIDEGNVGRNMYCMKCGKYKDKEGSIRGFHYGT